MVFYIAFVSQAACDDGSCSVSISVLVAFSRVRMATQNFTHLKSCLSATILESMPLGLSLPLCSSFLSSLEQKPTSTAPTCGCRY
jgi:hypothetical protein